MSPARRFTSTVEWPCFELFTALIDAAQGRSAGEEACSQGWGSMITEPPTDGQRRPLQEFETLYIGVATPAVRRALSAPPGRIKTMRDSEGSLTTTIARSVSIASWGRVQWNKVRG